MDNFRRKSKNGSKNIFKDGFDFGFIQGCTTTIHTTTIHTTTIHATTNNTTTIHTISTT